MTLYLNGHYILPACIVNINTLPRHNITSKSFIKLSRLFDKNAYVSLTCSNKKLYDYMIQQLKE